MLLSDVYGCNFDQYSHCSSLKRVPTINDERSFDKIQTDGWIEPWDPCDRMALVKQWLPMSSPYSNQERRRRSWRWGVSWNDHWVEEGSEAWKPINGPQDREHL